MLRAPKIAVHSLVSQTYTFDMEVSGSELRAHLREYIAMARGGEEVVVTNRGVPVARLVSINKEMEVLERLTREGVLDPPLSRKKIRVTRKGLLRASVSVSDLVIEMRR